MSNKVIVNGTEISGSYLLGGNVKSSHAMVGETLSADQFSCEVSTVDVPFIPADQETALITADYRSYYAKNDIDVTAFNDGDEVLFYDGLNLVGKYYFEEVIQVSANKYKINAVSIIGRLLDSKHYGGIYVQVPSSVVFESILSGINYEIDPGVSSSTVTGYLPIANRRDNLQQLLAATGSTIKVDNFGAIYISPMVTVSSGEFTAKRCYENGKVTTSKTVLGVKVTEHNYFEAGNVVTLFNDGVDGEELIEFREPYHDLQIEGGVIMESGANYARISAKGTVTLTGKPYTHVTRIVTAGTVGSGSTENVKTVSNCYLANPQIAQALADRLYEYLKCNRTITQDVLTGTERAGDVVSVINPYTMEMETATIKRFDITMSGINKANAEFLVGFVPQGVISGFKNYAMLTASGKWTVPDGVTKIRIILVGGGSGGGGGRRGSAGQNSDAPDDDDYYGPAPEPGEGGSGGSAGKAGPGGRIFEISLDVTPGQVFDFSCGIGGIGGKGQTETTKETEGTAGTPTTFGGYSSDYGRLYPYGYFEAKTGLTFSAAGLDGYDGGAGGRGNDTEYDENTGAYLKGEDGEAVEGYAGGVGARFTYTGDYDRRNVTEYYGGGGGGAAYGTKGGNANASNGGSGAKGAAGLTGVNPGQGGGAGNGGGGGGGAGTIYHWNPTYDNSYYISAPGGAPGDGSDGGTGANGAIVIYY